MDENLKTYRQWMREGRVPHKGAKAEQYLLNAEMTSGRGLFRRDQTELADQPDVAETEGWDLVVPVSEWEAIKAELRATSRGPSVKVRPATGGGTDVWCGPNTTIIGWLKDAGYNFNPKSRYWHHPNKDPREIAAAFRGASADGKRIKVTVDSALLPPAPEGI